MTMGRMLRKVLRLIVALGGDEWRARCFRWMGARVGKGCRLFVHDLGTEPYLISIGDRCTIAGGCRFVTHDGATWVLRREHPDVNRFGRIDVRDNSFLGIDVIVMPNVTIGPNSIVGAGSLVARDIPPNSVAAGVPARVLMTLDDYRAQCLAQTLDLSSDPKVRRRQLVAHFWGTEDGRAAGEALD